MLSLFVQRVLLETPNPVIFEFGACDGRYTNAMLFCCQKGTPTVYSFEPDPRNVPVFLKNKADLVNFFPDAIGDVTGTVPFHLASAQANGEIGSSSISPFKSQTAAFPWCKEEGIAYIQSWRLDDFCVEHGVKYIDFIFMDIQGAERLMIEGARDMLRSTRYLWTEFEGIRIKDEGTCYEHSSSLERISQQLGHDWEIAQIAGGDALLVNSKCDSRNPNRPVDLLYSPIRFE